MNSLRRIRAGRLVCSTCDAKATIQHRTDAGMDLYCDDDAATLTDQPLPAKIGDSITINDQPAPLSKEKTVTTKTASAKPAAKPAAKKAPAKRPASKYSAKRPSRKPAAAPKAPVAKKAPAKPASKATAPVKEERSFVVGIGKEYLKAIGKDWIDVDTVVGLAKTFPSVAAARAYLTRTGITHIDDTPVIISTVLNGRISRRKDDAPIPAF